jgi:hypothetical protein
MIEWLTQAELGERLRQYTPIGLTLRTLFQARTSAAPETWFSRAPETAEEAGLGEMRVWAGLVDSTPFAITAMARRSGWGFEVRLPNRIEGDSALLDRIRALGLPRWSHPYFCVLPSRGGFGVAPVGSSVPVYVSEQREKASSVASMLNSVEPATYAVISTPATDPAWLVIGPESGPYISRIEVIDDEHAAVAEADRLSRSTGTAFHVRRAP